MRSYLRLTLILCAAIVGCNKDESAPDPAPIKVEAPAAQEPVAAPTTTVSTTTTLTKAPTEQAGLGSAFTNQGKLINGQPAATSTATQTTGPAFGSLGGTTTAKPTTTAPAATTAAPKPTATATAATPGRGVPPPPGGRPKPGSKS